MSSSYRPGDYQASTLHNLPTPPPPPEMSSLSEPTARYDFRNGDSWRPPNSDFTFRVQWESEVSESTRSGRHAAHESEVSRAPRPERYSIREPEASASIRPRQYAVQERNRQDFENNLRLGPRDSLVNPRILRARNLDRRRGPKQHVATAERQLLSVKHGEAHEQMFGTAHDLSGTKHFLDADDMSDSEEEQMDESESDKPENDVVNEGLLGSSTNTLFDTASDIIEPPAKKRALESTKFGLESGSSVPRWSNPDPYTVLPPTDDAHRKKKDVVKLIRKARIVAEKSVDVKSQVAVNDDFISFGFEDEPAVRNSDEHKGFITKYSDKGQICVAGAPTGPRQFSRLQNLRDLSLHSAPGTQSSLNANSLGPPPSLTPSVNANSNIGKPNIESTQDNMGLSISYLDLTQDAALGNRKRTHEDVIKGPLQEPPKRRRGIPGSPTGSLLEEWMPTSNTDPTPWLEHESNYKSENAGFRLHKEICDFYQFVRPQKYEQIVREELLGRIKTIVKDKLNCEVHCFGSFAAGLYLPNADMDLVVISEEFRTSGQKKACQTNSAMYRFSLYLKQRIAEKDTVEVIQRAKVPLIKFVDRLTAIKVDMSFENHTGLIANRTFSDWKNQFPAMPILVTLIKQFLMMRGLNEVVNGGLGGFSVTCLVTSLLQNMPRVQSGELVPEYHLGEMLIEFLDFYGNQFDCSRAGIKLNPPGYFAKKNYARNASRQVYQANKTDRLAIRDPNLPDNDISGGSKNVLLIFDRFSRAHEELLLAMKSSTRPSLLDWLLGGNYGTFLWQRAHLRKLFKEKWGSPNPDALESLAHDCVQHHDLLYTKDLSIKEGTSSQTVEYPHSLDFVANHVKIDFLKSIPAPTKASQSKLRRKALRKSLRLQAPKALKKKAPKPQIIEKKLDTATKERNRATRLKEKFPNMEGIPDQITKRRERALLLQHAQKMQRSRGPGGSLREPKITEAKRTEVARTIIGLSTDNPIFIV